MVAQNTDIKYTAWEKAIFILAIVNFVSFMVIAVWIGGDALNGKAVNGHYFVDSHGADTEVSHAVFIYSQVHATSIFITHGLAFFAAYRARARK